MGEDRQHEMVIQREERKLERARAKADAYEETMTKTIAAYLKDANNRRNVAKDAMLATKDPSRREALFDKAGHGGFFDNKPDGIGEDDVITGREDRPWER